LNTEEVACGHPRDRKRVATAALPKAARERGVLTIFPAVRRIFALLSRLRYYDSSFVETEMKYRYVNTQQALKPHIIF
jgi:isopentenyldiphosphate isomerase